MKRHPIGTLLIVAVVISLLVAACSPTPTASPSPSPKPTAAPTTTAPEVKPTPTASATPAASPSPKPTQSPAATVKPLKLKFYNFFAENAVYAQTVKWWTSELAKRSNGRIAPELYWSASLGPATDALDIVGTNIAQAGIIAAGYTPSKLPLAGGIDNVYQSPSPWVIAKAIEEMYSKNAALRREFQQNSVLFMAQCPLDPSIIVSKDPITSLENLKGVKIRTYGRMGWVFDKLGATPVSIATPEVYTALQRGTIQAAASINWGGILGFKLQEVADYILESLMGPQAFFAIVMNLDFYNSLPDDLKEMVAQLNSEVPEQGTAILAQGTLEVYNQLKKEGKTINVLSAEEAQRWKNLVVPGLFDAWVEEVTKAGVPGAANFLKDYQELLKKYQAQDKWAVKFQFK